MISPELNRPLKPRPAYLPGDRYNNNPRLVVVAVTWRDDINGGDWVYSVTRAPVNGAAPVRGAA